MKNSSQFNFNYQCVCFQRGQIYYISKVDASTEPPIYYLNDLADDVVPGHFYKQQLRLAPDPKTIMYEIEKTLKTRTVKGKKQKLVKWLMYPNKFNTWEDEKNIIKGADSDSKAKRKK